MEPVLSCRTSRRWSAIYRAWSVELIGRCHPETTDRIALRHVRRTTIPDWRTRRRRVDSPWAARTHRQPARWQTVGRTQRRCVMWFFPSDFSPMPRQHLYLLFAYKTALSVETAAERRQDRLWDAYLYGRCKWPTLLHYHSLIAYIFIADIFANIFTTRKCGMIIRSIASASQSVSQSVCLSVCLFGSNF